MLHCGFEDPDQPGLDYEELLSVFRRVRDEIGKYSRELLDSVYSDPKLVSEL